MKRCLASLVAAMIVFFAIVASAQSKPPLRLVQTIPLPDLKEGDFDHFALDLAGKRLFLTAEANNAVVVLDTSANKWIHTIPDLDEPHSMLFLPAAKQLWVIAGGAAKIFDSDAYTLTETVKLTEGADSSAYDTAKHLLYVAAGRKLVTSMWTRQILRRWPSRKRVPGSMPISGIRASSA